jgi:predicted MFS family arabinose efflux permease
MSLKRYLIIMSLSTLLLWLAWGLVIIFIDPVTGGIMGVSLFYISLFLALTGSFSVIGFFVRSRFAKKEEVLFNQVGVSLRHAILFSVLITGSLLLQSNRLLTWWNALIFIVILIVIESLFMMRSNENKSHAR